MKTILLVVGILLICLLLGRIIFADFMGSDDRKSNEALNKNHEPDTYSWQQGNHTRVYLWRCFPKLPFPTDVPKNEGREIDVDLAWENWNPDPTGLYAWYESSTYDVHGTYTNNVWGWTPPNYQVCSQRGYKMQRTGTGYPVMFSRGLLCEANVELVTTTTDEDWLGYFLPSTQKVLDAFPSDVADDAIKIWTQDWCISRSTTSDPWTGTPASCTLHYMDAVMITTVDNDYRFEWETPAREEELGYRPVAEHFTFVDEIDYQPVYAYFEEENLPQEVAIYVNDVCKGAQVVEDTISQICAYILEEDEGEEIEFAFWYDDRSEIERCNSYSVFDEDADVFRQQSLLTGTPGIHYEVSFKGGYEEVIPVDHNLLCYPNPFNPELTISFNLEAQKEVKLDIYNVKGQKVKSLAAETFRPDDYNIVWKGDDNAGNKVSSGVYYIRLQVGEEIVNRKVILMK
ncbi:MAG: T9SS type A sorting domain-containing protein [Candidatus Stygibacter australis]|nr:T9SS type A sorting domain-containing protein [Candidatus Stygibacter australis]